ncbi:MAG: hypothetical protein QM767_25315 [Anaeromyxobacter sp.]
MIAALALAGLLAADPALPEARPLDVRAELSRGEVKLGEPFTLAVEIRHAPDETYLLPEHLAAEPFRAAGQGRCSRAGRAPAEVVTTCTVPLALYALGEQQLPTLSLPVQTPRGPAVLTLAGPPVTGVGLIDPTVPTEELALRDPAPPVPLMVRSLRLLWWTLGILGGLAALALLVRALLRLRHRPRKAAPPLPPHVRFARRLDALEGERLPEQGRGEEHVARLSELVREYLGSLTRLPALDLTSGELLAGLRAAPDPRLELEALEGFLAEADLVKFARAQPTAAGCAAGTAYARRLLAATRPAAAQEAQ